MRSYELIFIVHPEVDGDDLTAVVDRVKAFVERVGGRVVQTEPWGLRRLAYTIRKQWEGRYVLMQLELEPQGVAALERDIGLTEQIMRHLIVRVEDDVKSAGPAKGTEPVETAEPAGDAGTTESATE